MLKQKKGGCTNHPPDHKRLPYEKKVNSMFNQWNFTTNSFAFQEQIKYYSVNHKDDLAR